MASQKQERDERRQRLSARKQAEDHKSGFERTAYMVPEGINTFVAKTGQYNLDIIPYTVPDDTQGNPYHEAGDLAYVRHFFQHRDIGPNGDAYICAAKTAKLPCPICERRRELVREASVGDKEAADLIKSLEPKERQLFNVVNLDDLDRGVQVWEISFHNFGKQLNARIVNSPESKGFEYFADPIDGMTINVGFADVSIGKGKPFSQAASIDFDSRGPLSQDVLDAAQPLDSLLIVPGLTKDANGKFLISYEKLKEIFLQTGASEEEGDGEPEPEVPAAPPAKPAAKAAKPAAKAPPAASPAGKPAAPAAGKPAAVTAASKGITPRAAVQHKTLGDCEVLKISPDGMAVNLLCLKDDEVHKNIPVTDVRLPAKAAPAPAPAPAAPAVKHGTPAKTPPKKPAPAPAPEPEPEAAPFADDGDDWGEAANDMGGEAAAPAAGDDDWDQGWES